MTDSFNERSNRGSGLDKRKKNIILVAVLAIFLIVLIIIAIFGIKKALEKNKSGETTPTPIPTATVTITTTPSATPTKTAVKTATPTPSATPKTAENATPTVTPTVTPTAVPVVISTPTPVLEEGKISAEEACKLLQRYSKETLNISKDLSEYDIQYDSSTTLINGKNCYRFNISETVDGKVRNRGEFYISDDGTSCFVEDVESSTFVPLPQG